jgi:hypothetical protein
MRSIALVPGPAAGQYHWPGLDQINAILAADGVKISVTEISHSLAKSRNAVL